MRSLIPMFLMIWGGSPIAGPLLDLQVEESTLTAQDPEPVAVRAKALTREYRKAKRTYRKALRRAETDEEKAALEAENPAFPYLDRFRELAQEGPASFEVVDGMVRLHVDLPADGQDALLAELLERHVDREALDKACLAAMRAESTAAYRFLVGVSEASPHANIRAAALFGRAVFVDTKRRLTGDERFSDDVQRDAEVLRLYNLIDSDYPDARVRGMAVGEVVKKELFAVRNLAIGKVAPDIVGEDVDGVGFKLSDYRGKVVLLDFWGDW